jgi:hypothetical protein
MADGFDIRIEGEQAERLRSAARAAGVDVVAYTQDLLAQSMPGFEEDDRRWGEYLQTGETVSVGEAFAAFDAEIARIRANKAG